jgi:drug/metabolite transporter (DMT)-like permease
MSDAALPAPATSPAGATRRQRLAAIALIVGSVACFTVTDTSAKFLVTSGYPVEQVVWARYAVNVALLFVVLNPWTVPGLFRAKRPGLQILRSGFLVLSTGCNFFALQFLPLADAVAIMYTAPMIVALLAGVVFGQWLGPRRAVAVAVGFAGILIVTRPGLGGIHWAAALSLAAAASYACYQIATRLLAGQDSTATTLTYSGLVGALVLTPFVPSVFVAPKGGLDLALMIACGASATLGHYMLILANKHMPAQALAPFGYVQIVWMTLAGWWVFGDVPGWPTIVGAGVVIASGLYLLALERRGT